MSTEVRYDRQFPKRSIDENNLIRANIQKYLFKRVVNFYTLIVTVLIASLISLIRVRSFSMALPTTITSAPALQFR